jgi:putative ABC transport system permease protein
VSGWRPALRIGSRSILGSRGRSLLIATLVGLPVAAATYADVIAHTFSSPELTAQQMVGSADGAITVTSQRELPGYMPRWLLANGPEPAPQRDPAAVDLPALLPRGSLLAPMPRYQPVELRAGQQVVATRILLGDVRQPMQRFVLRLSAGSPLPRAGEVVVTRSLAVRLHLLDGGKLRQGASITLVNGLRTPVAGLARDPSCLSCEQIVARPGSAIARAAAARSPLAGYAYQTPNGNTVTAPTYLVDLPTGTDVAALGSALATRGVALTTRAALAHTVPGQPSRNAPSPAGLVTLISALGLLEVVLLAGAAFAVGARRQVRELGLVAATGGGPRDIRRIVLAQGLVLSVLGAVLGITAGAAVAVAGRPFWEQLANTETAGWAFSPIEIAIAALAGVLAGVTASVIPAIGASRMPPVDALAARFRVGLRSGRGLLLAGSVLVASGAALGLLANHLLARDFAAYERVLPAAAITGRDISPPSPGGPTSLIAAGAILAVIGLALLTPVILGGVAAAGSHLPLSARLAVRDAARHRHRTGPATSAIVVVVAGSTALAYILAGSFHAEGTRDRPSLPPHTIAVQPIAGSAQTLLSAATRAARQLPAGRRHVLLIPFLPGDKPALGLTDESGRALSVVRQDRSCPAHLPAGICSPIAIPPGGPLAIGGDDAVSRLVAGHSLDRTALHALESGAVLVFDATMLGRDRHVEVDTPRGRVRLPGRLVRVDHTYGLLPAGLVSGRTARAHGWAIGAGSVFITYSARASSDSVDAALTAAQQAGATAVRNTGPDKPVSLVLALLAAAAAFVTLAAVAVCVALSVAESQADFATLAAIGAQPGRRRALAASQALLVGGIGSALGMGLGTFIGFTAHRTTGSATFVVPWADLAATGVAVPLLAALVAALCTRGRLPMLVRAE